MQIKKHSGIGIDGLRDTRGRFEVNTILANTINNEINACAGTKKRPIPLQPLLTLWIAAAASVGLTTYVNYLAKQSTCKVK